VVDLAGAIGIDPQDLALHGGEDYELLAAMPPQAVDDARRRMQRFGTRLTAIGEITDEQRVVAVRGEEESLLEAKGWDHFAR
jgi:thiamine-monophosphate kinase